MRFPKMKYAILGATLILAAIAGVFAVQLFTQTFPAITRPSPPVVLQPNCQTLVADNSTIPTVGTTGYILFNCGASTAAFKMIQNASVTPVFTLPSGYVSLWVTTSDCNSLFTGLPSGLPVLLSKGSYDYCALTDASTAALGTFSVTWVSGQKDNTSMSISCPGSITEVQASSCSVTVTDTTNSTITPTGTVTFSSSDTTSGTVGASCTLNGSGSCSINIHGVPGGGVFTVTGTYLGDPAHNGSSKTSANIIVTIVCNPICT